MNGDGTEAAITGAGGAGGKAETEAQGRGLRVDKWLWFARFFKSRSRATALCATAKLRVSGQLVRKPHHLIRAGDVLTFPQGGRIRVIRVKALGHRRGPAAEAQALYEDLAPARPGTPDLVPRLMVPARRARGAGRPTKADRRAITRLTGD